MLLAMVTARPSAAQTQAQQDRLDQIGLFLVTAPTCGQLGMTLADDFPGKAATAMYAETASWNLDRATVDKLAADASNRQERLFATDQQAAIDGAKTAPQLRALKSIFMRYARTCLMAAADPIYAKLISVPAGFDADRAATDYIDKLLEVGGLASWQTPQIQARGDLMMLAGICRSRIGSARSDALVREFGQSDDPRVRNYYRKAFDTGLADPGTISTLAGCNRAIARNRVKAG